MVTLLGTAMHAFALRTPHGVHVHTVQSRGPRQDAPSPCPCRGRGRGTCLHPLYLRSILCCAFLLGASSSACISSNPRSPTPGPLGLGSVHTLWHGSYHCHLRQVAVLKGGGPRVCSPISVPGNLVWCLYTAGAQHGKQRLKKAKRSGDAWYLMTQSHDYLTSSRKTLGDTPRVTMAPEAAPALWAGSKAPGPPCQQACEPAHNPVRYSLPKRRHRSLFILSHRKWGDIGTGHSQSCCTVKGPCLQMCSYHSRPRG